MSEDCKNCPYEAIIEELRRDATRNSEQHREFYNRFNEQEKAIAISEERYNNLLTCITEVKDTLNMLSSNVQSLVTISNRVDSLEDTIKEIKDKPAKRWDNVVNYIITAVIGIVLGFIATHLGF